MRQTTTMQHTGTHQREGTRSHAFPIAQRRACAPGRIVSLTRRGDKNGDGTIAPIEFDTANLAYDTLGRVTQGITDAWYPAQFTYNALDRVIRSTDANGKLRDYEPSRVGTSLCAHADKCEMNEQRTMV